MTRDRRRHRLPSWAVVVLCTVVLFLAMLNALSLRTSQRDKSDAVALSYAAQVKVACDDPAQRAQLIEVGVRCSSVDDAVKALQDGDTPPPVVVPGATGASGTPGPRGFNGSTGATGAAGPAGPRGPRGVDGAPGPVGDPGPAGAPGAAGARGPAGDTGPAGPQGPKGDTGDTGPQGDTGPAGAAGVDGAPGAQGATGPAGTALPGTYTCGDAETLHGFTVAPDGAVTLDCRPTAVLIP